MICKKCGCEQLGKEKYRRVCGRQFVEITSSSPFSVTSDGKLTEYVGDDGDFTVPDGVSSISRIRFKKSTRINILTIPESVTEIADEAFVGAESIAKIIVDPHNKVFDSRNGCNAVIEKATNRLVVGGENSVIPDGVTEIGFGAFEGRSELKTINVPKSVRKIDERAFAWCSNLSRLSLPSELQSIESGAFFACKKLRRFTLPKGTKEIGIYILASCESLMQLTVEEGNRIFDSRDNCNAIILTRYKELLVGCKTTVIPNNVTAISCGAFANSAIKSITIPQSVREIKDNAFFCCTKLSRLELSNGIKVIGENAFSNCTALKELHIPRSVIQTEDNSFSELSSLESVSVEPGSFIWESPEGSNVILERGRKRLVLGCENSVIPKGVKIISSDAFSHNNLIRQCIIPEGTEIIESRAFYECSNLLIIDLPKSIKHINARAFGDCNKLFAVNYGGSSQEWQKIQIDDDNDKLLSALLCCRGDQNISN